MKLHNIWPILASVVCTGALAAVPQAVTDGQAAGGDAVNYSAGLITNTQADSIKNSNTTTGADATTVQNLQAEFATSNAGNSGLATPGSNHVNDCKTYTPNQTKLSQTPPDPVELAKFQECSAVNDLTNQPLQHAIIASGLTKSDSLFQDPNNMFNYAKQNTVGIAGSALASTGSGVGSTSGGGACVTTTSVTPAEYTQGSCTRSLIPSTQPCQVQAVPSIKKTPFCTISGSTDVVSPDNPKMMTWINGPWTVQAGPHGVITYQCLDPADPLYALGGIATYTPNPKWFTTGGINFSYQNPRKIILPFSTGVTTGIKSLRIGNYNSTTLGTLSMYYDGPTDKFYVSYKWEPFFEPFGGVYVDAWFASTPQGRVLTLQNYPDKLAYWYGGSPPVSLGVKQPMPPLVSCAPGYTLKVLQDATYVIAPSTIGSSGSAFSPPPYMYCYSPSDPSTVEYRQQTQIVKTVPRLGVVESKYLDCVAIDLWTSSCKLKPQYFLGSGWSYSFNSVGNCFNASGCEIGEYIACKSGFTLHADPAGSAIGYCYPSKYEVELGTLNTDRALRLYGEQTGHYSGSAGTTTSLVDNVNDSCATLQAQTTAPTATPAVAVNGKFVCPSGKTLSGAYCI